MKIIVSLALMGLMILSVHSLCFAEVTPEQYQIVLDTLRKGFDVRVEIDELNTMLQQVKSHIDPSNPLTVNVSWENIVEIYLPVYLQGKQDVQDALNNMP